MKDKPEISRASKSRPWSWWLGGLALSACLLGAAFYFDAEVQNWVTQHQTHSGKIWMRNVSAWGDWPLHVALGLAAAAIAYSLGKRRWFAIFAAMVVASAVAGLLNDGIKIATGRARPSVEADVGWNGPTLSPKYHAFTSGHTISSTAFFGVLVCARRRVGLLFLPIPFIIAASRVYLNAHHLSDVVAGMILGVYFAISVWRLLGARLEQGRALS